MAAVAVSGKLCFHRIITEAVTEVVKGIHLILLSQFFFLWEKYHKILIDLSINFTFGTKKMTKKWKICIYISKLKNGKIIPKSEQIKKKRKEKESACKWIVIFKNKKLLYGTIRMPTAIIERTFLS